MCGGRGGWEKQEFCLSLQGDATFSCRVPLLRLHLLMGELAASGLWQHSGGGPDFRAVAAFQHSGGSGPTGAVVAFRWR